jgi:hypothetical protein
MVCWALACLVLSASASKPACTTRRRFRAQGNPRTGSPTASVFKSTQFDPARARSLTSLVLEDAWAERYIGPPGQGTHGPPEDERNLPVAGQRLQL